MKTIKSTEHSRISSRKFSKTQKKCWNYEVNSKSTYDKLFEAYNQCGKDKDYELTHSIEDDILHKFIYEIINNNYKTKKEIIASARLISKNVLTQKYKKWYA